jgi:hypothetical protein
MRYHEMVLRLVGAMGLWCRVCKYSVTVVSGQFLAAPRFARLLIRRRFPLQSITAAVCGVHIALAGFANTVKGGGFRDRECVELRRRLIVEKISGSWRGYWR